MMNALRKILQEEGDTTFSVKVRPQATRTCFKQPLADGTLKIDLAALPEDGEANEELVRFLAEEFSVGKENIEIVSGKAARMKILRVVRSK